MNAAVDHLQSSISHIAAAFLSNLEATSSMAPNNMALAGVKVLELEGADLTILTKTKLRGLVVEIIGRSISQVLALAL